MEKSFLAFDLGATSGRTILGTIKDGKISIEELTRFPNQFIQINGHFHWNIFSLHEHLVAGLKACAAKGCKVESIGIDTWGVDFAFIGSDDSVLGMPFAYRDLHTTGAPEEFFDKKISRREVYEATGIQVMNFNSLYQLYVLNKNKSSQLAAATKIAFMPDALSFMMTGNVVTEYTIASTAQMINPRTKKFEKSLLEAVGLSEDMFGEIVMPGHVIGLLTEELAAECGMERVPVIAVAGHDTGSAVAAVPAKDEKFAYLSSGTWSLMGIETKDPVITDETYTINFTNEGGIEGTTRLLKNITGMWLLEQCIKEWKAEKIEYTYPEIVKMAEGAEPFRSIVNPDDESFAAPKSMLKAIADYCKKTNQPVPETHQQFVRCIFESLAMRYRSVFDILKGLATFPIERLHIIGGGSRNMLLNQFTANALGVPVFSGPAEATAIGNVMVQAKAAGVVDSLKSMREVIAHSVEMQQFDPQDAEKWNTAYDKICKIY